MPIDTTCLHCGTDLTVGDEFSDREVRCPRCDHVFVASASYPSEVLGESGGPKESQQGDQSADHELAKSDPIASWLLRTPEGNLFGPVDRDTLAQWVREGRVSADCQLSDSAGAEWRLAVAEYPMLAEQGNPFASQPHSKPTKHQAAHRGPLILFLALVGCVVPLVCFAAAFMGIQDLKRMQAGKMDRDGEGLTRAGQVIATVASMVWITAFAIVLLALLVRAMSNA